MKSRAKRHVGATDGGSPTESAVARAAEATKGTAPKAVYIRESSVENYLRSEVKKRRHLCMMEKHVSPGKRGVPDDLITWGAPLYAMELIETKAPKGSRKKHQIRDHTERLRYGIKVWTLYTREQVDAYFKSRDAMMSLV